MQVNYKDKVIDIEPNSKPYFLKHIISDMFDVMTLFLLFFVINLGLFKSPIANTYYSHQAEATKIIDNCRLETGMGYQEFVNDETDISGKTVYTDSDGKEYIVVINKDATSEQKQEFATKMNSSQAYKDEIFASNLHRYLISMLSISLAGLPLLLIVPLTNKKRATAGQLLTGIALFSKGRQTYAKWYSPLIRYILYFGGFVILYPWTDIVTFLVIPVIDLIIMLINKDNKTIRDYMSGTMLIENKSYSSLEYKANLDNKTK
jgi:hypothetical protein